MERAWEIHAKMEEPKLTDSDSELKIVVDQQSSEKTKPESSVNTVSHG